MEALQLVVEFLKSNDREGKLHMITLSCFIVRYFVADKNTFKEKMTQLGFRNPGGALDWTMFINDSRCESRDPKLGLVDHIFDP